MPAVPTCSKDTVGIIFAGKKCVAGFSGRLVQYVRGCPGPCYVGSVVALSDQQRRSTAATKSCWQTTCSPHTRYRIRHRRRRQKRPIDATLALSDQQPCGEGQISSGPYQALQQRCARGERRRRSTDATINRRKYPLQVPCLGSPRTICPAACVLPPVDVDRRSK